MKSHFFAEKTVMDCLNHDGLRQVCVREVQKDLKHSAKRLIEDKLFKFEVDDLFDVKNDHIITPGNGIILFQGMQDHTAESIKSLERFERAWVEEAQTLSAKSLELLRPTIREEGSELWFSWNPRTAKDPVDKLLRGVAPDDAIVIRTSYKDNPWFPDVLEQERIYDQQNNPERYAHIWLGEYEPMAIGAIWNRINIQENRRRDTPEMGRILVAIDPAISAEENSNENGIIVVGHGVDGHGYVLDDMSMVGPPGAWARQAVTAFDKWDADAIVIETNQGGDMCKHTLSTVRQYLPIIEVKATRGKHVRAEPISALYDMNQISHVGTFDDLESQMCQMTAKGWEGPKEESPDRVDAMVWGFTELFPKIIRKRPKPKAVAQTYQGEGGWMG